MRGKKISVVSRKDKKELQLITPPDDNCNYCLGGLDTSVTFAFVAEDMNFDGYTDFRLMNFMPAFSWNVSFYYWLYNPSKNTFERDTTLEEIQGPEFNPHMKEIKNYWNFNGESGSNTYKYIKGKLTLIETENTKTIYVNEKPREITARKRLVNDQWVKLK